MPARKSDASGRQPTPDGASSPTSSMKKSSSFYMRKMRAGLAEAGYVKHEAWVLPENRSLLKSVERQLRQPIMAGTFKLEEHMATTEKWTTDSLFASLQALEQVKTGEIALELIQGGEPSIELKMKDYGELPIFIAVVGEQIIVDTVLVDQESINNVPGFNDAVLRSREMFPLSSIGIESMPNGQTVYNMFGALSADSSLTNVATEIFTLVENVERFTEVFTDFFKQ